MAVMASWNGKTWGVSSQRIAALNGVSSSVELDTENSDDKAGSPATKTKALKLQSMTGITLKSGVWNASLQRLEC